MAQEGRFRDEFVVWCFLGLSRPVEFALPFFSSLNFAEPISPHLVEVFPRLCSFVSPVAAAAEGGQAAVLRLLLAYGASANHTDWRSIPVRGDGKDTPMPSEAAASPLLTMRR